MNVKVKICGLNSEAAAKATSDHGADFAGFVFFPPSPRHLDIVKANNIKKHLAGHIKIVAVTVDMVDAELEAIAKEFSPHYIQLHGNESPERVREVKKRFAIPVIKALAVRSGDDVAKANAYDGVTDMLMFDAKPPKHAAALPGGNGLSFDWQLLRGRKFTSEWLLSGGLNSNNVAEAVRITGANFVDVSSSVESAPGVKDPQRIAEFITAVKNIR